MPAPQRMLQNGSLPCARHLFKKKARRMASIAAVKLQTNVSLGVVCRCLSEVANSDIVAIKIPWDLKRREHRVCQSRVWIQRCPCFAELRRRDASAMPQCHTLFASQLWYRRRALRESRYWFPRRAWVFSLFPSVVEGLGIRRRNARTWRNWSANRQYQSWHWRYRRRWRGTDSWTVMCGNADQELQC